MVALTNVFAPPLFAFQKSPILQINSYEKLKKGFIGIWESLKVVVISRPWRLEAAIS